MNAAAVGCTRPELSAGVNPDQQTPRRALLADAVRIVEQWADDELVGSERRRVRKLFGQLSARCGGDYQLVSPFGRVLARRARVAAARLFWFSPFSTS